MAALTIGHELTYVLAHGLGDRYQEAMRAGGHDAYWASFVLTVGGITAALAGVVVVQLRRLQAAARLAGRDHVAVDEGPSLSSLLVGLFPRVAVATIGLFLVQENIELAAAGHALPGLDVVAGEHWSALPILLLVSLAAALVGALLAWRRAILRARLAQVTRWARPVSSRPRTASRRRPFVGIRPAAHGLRAPPVTSAA